MSDIIAQLQVLSKESGCLLDLSTLIDLSVCPKIDILTPGRHHTEDKDDHIYVTPSEDKGNQYPVNNYPVNDGPDSDYPVNGYYRRSDYEDSCYKVSDEVCQKPTVSLDLQLPVVLGLLNNNELEDYCRSAGIIGRDDCVKVEECDVKVDPLLSLDVGGKEGLNLEVAGEDGLVSLDLGGKNMLNIGRGEDDSLVNIEENPIKVDARSEHVECKGEQKHGDLYSHYQPVCKKGFKQEYGNQAHHCHANDVNHCLAKCNADSALLTLNADVEVGNIADILLCVAVEFDQASEGNNCRYVVAPEHKPCTEDELEDVEDSCAFIRN